MTRETKHERLIELMRVRYDFYSARAVLERALEEAGLTEQGAYSPEEVRRIADQLATRTRDRVEHLVDQLRLQASVADCQPEPEAMKPAPDAKRRWSPQRRARTSQALPRHRGGKARMGARGAEAWARPASGP